MKKILLIVIIWFVIVTLFGLLVLHRFNLQPDEAYGWMKNIDYLQPQSWNPIDMQIRWDSNWYLDIAKNGYQYRIGELSNIVFFPLYPLLIKIIGTVVNGQFGFAGWLINIVSLCGATAFLYRLMREQHTDIDSTQTVMMMLIFPTAFFFSIIYTESLFLFFSIATFFYALRRQFLFASLFGLAAALTRVTGILLIFPLLIEIVQIHRQDHTWRPTYLSVLLIPGAVAAFFLFHLARFGDFLLFFKVESSWGRFFAFNPDHFQIFSSASITNLILDIVIVSTVFILSILVIKRLRLSYGIYMLVTVAAAAGTGTLMSIGRYVLVLFPMFILLAKYKNTLFLRGWTFVSALLFALYTTLLVNWYWAG
jgi:Gpi18-like mannosyltransferase